ncbi:MAG TPA: hypothetical protein VGB92_25970 [Longimicrobium sp.]
MTLLATLQAWLPLLVLLSLVISALSWWAMWRLSRGEIAALETRCTESEARIARLEYRDSMRPTAEDTHLLGLRMAEFTQKMEGFTARIDLDRRQVVAEIQGARELFNVQIVATEGLVVRTEKTVEETGRNLRMLLEHMLTKGV